MPVFNRLLLQVGLPFGLLIALIVSESRLDFLVTLVLAALGFTAVLVGVTELFIRHIRRSTASEAALCGLIIATTFVAGPATVGLARRAPHGRWEELPVTPEPVGAFVSPTCHHMNG